MKSKWILFWVCFCANFVGINAQIMLFNQEQNRISIQNEQNINTENLESSPSFWGDKLTFMYSGIKEKIFDTRIDEPFFDIGYCDIDTFNHLNKRNSFPKQINGDFHEGAMDYDLNTNKLYFTRTYKAFKLGGQDTMYLKIFETDLNIGKPKPKLLNITDGDFSLAHPALDLAGHHMILASGKKPNVGKMDLYTTEKIDGAWTEIIPLKGEINTDANEVFPVWLRDSILIFSSDRKGGYGGLDLYISLKTPEGSWSAAKLLPQPFNSPYDDFSLVVRPDGKSGYFSSNRPGGKGKDDIYSFTSEHDLFVNSIRSVEFSISVMDKLTLEPISGATISLTPLEVDINNFTLTSFNIDVLAGTDPGDLLLKLTPKKGISLPLIYSDSEGKAYPNLVLSKQYIIHVEAEEYEPISLLIDGQNTSTNFNIVMTPADSQNEIFVSDNAPKKDTSIFAKKFEKGDVIVFNDIFYAYNRSDILENQSYELDALATALLENPRMKIRLESHTDARGNAAYNMQLSLKRAESARAYLIEKGVEEDQIDIKGYGESKIRNHCANGIPCNEKEHQFNRRTEVVILEN